VELNAFTSDQFVKWLEAKLNEHGINKVIPGTATLQQTYCRAAGRKHCQAILDREAAKLNSCTETVEVPADLRERVERCGRSVSIKIVRLHS
jgi:hypothetical protein